MSPLKTHLPLLRLIYWLSLLTVPLSVKGDYSLFYFDWFCVWFPVTANGECKWGCSDCLCTLNYCWCKIQCVHKISTQIQHVNYCKRKESALSFEFWSENWTWTCMDVFSFLSFFVVNFMCVRDQAGGHKAGHWSEKWVWLIQNSKCKCFNMCSCYFKFVVLFQKTP